MNYNYGLDRIATIPSGQNQSQVVDIEFYNYVGIVMPAAWDAAALTFSVAPFFNGPLSPLHDALDAEVEITVQAGRAYGIELYSLLAPWRYVAVRSGTTAIPVNQTANRDVILVVK